MLVYYLVFFIAFSLSILDYSSNKYLKLVAYTAFCLVLVLLPALRGIGVDNDSSNYEDIFKLSGNYTIQEIITGDYVENIERGYMLLNKIINMLDGDVYTVFFIVAVATGILNYSIIYKISPFPFTSLLFYLSFFFLYRDFTQIRYGLSCAFVFWTVYFMLTQNWFKCGLCLFVAILFHNTAIIMLLVLPLCYLVKNKNVYLVFLIISLLGLIFNPFPILLSLVGMPEHMLIYLEEEGGGGFMVSLVGLFVTLLFIVYNNIFKQYSDLSFYFRAFIIGVALSLLFIQVSIFQRFSYLLFQFGVLLLPTMLFLVQKYKDRYFAVVLHLSYGAFLLYYGVKLIAPTLIRPYFY